MPGEPLVFPKLLYMDWLVHWKEGLLQTEKLDHYITLVVN